MKLLQNPKMYLFIICFLLLAIPFLWLKPGEMDLGGDSGRLYFYDPQTLFKMHSLYSIDPEGKGNVESIIYILPFLILNSIIKNILDSPYIIINVFNVLKLMVGFLATYAIIKELLQIKDQKYKETREFAAIIGGLFYIFSPMFIGNFDRALLNHDQVFLNPFIFYLFLKYLITTNKKYLWLVLILTLIFAHNFSWVSAPPIFAFYPLGMFFLMLYVAFIRRKKIPWRGVLIGFVLFLGLHAFHLLPALISIFDLGSNINTRIFSKQTSPLDYFFGVLPLAKVSLNFLSLPSIKEFNFLGIIGPLVVILGFLFNKGKSKTILLTGIIFLIIVFLLSAKVTNVGVNFYAWLFLNIPGFSMFRNFIGQWQFVFYFFYALLFGQALFFLLSKFSKKYVVTLSVVVGLLLIIGGWPFIDGSLVNKVHFQSNEVKYAIVMDPKYEKTLSYIRSLPEDVKIITLPFTDCCYQVIHGTNNGAYIGLSTISFLSDKKDFSGYIKIAPFSDVFLKLSKEKDYDSIKRMFGLLNIRYIFYNSDPKIYDTTFPGYPYSYVRQFLPNDQKEYGNFVKKLGGRQVFKNGSYHIYSVDDRYILPHIYIAKNLVSYDNDVDDWYGKTMSFFASEKNFDVRTVYVESDERVSMLDSKSSLPKIKFERVNPTRYKVKVSGAKDPYILVFSESFHKNWKIFLTGKEPKQGKIVRSYFNDEVTEGVHNNKFLDEFTFSTWGKTAIAEDKHFKVNGYANAWNIIPDETGGSDNYELTIELTNQRVFYIGLALSVIVFTGYLVWGMVLFIKRSSSDIIKKRND